MNNVSRSGQGSGLIASQPLQPSREGFLKPAPFASAFRFPSQSTTVMESCEFVKDEHLRSIYNICDHYQEGCKGVSDEEACLSEKLEAACELLSCGYTPRTTRLQCSSLEYTALLHNNLTERSTCYKFLTVDQVVHGHLSYDYQVVPVVLTSDGPVYCPEMENGCTPVSCGENLDFNLCTRHNLAATRADAPAKFARVPSVNRESYLDVVSRNRRQYENIRFDLKAILVCDVPYIFARTLEYGDLTWHVDHGRCVALPSYPEAQTFWNAVSSLLNSYHRGVITVDPVLLGTTLSGVRVGSDVAQRVHRQLCKRYRFTSGRLNTGKGTIAICNSVKETLERFIAQGFKDKKRDCYFPIGNLMRHAYEFTSLQSGQTLFSMDAWMSFGKALFDKWVVLNWNNVRFPVPDPSNKSRLIMQTFEIASQESHCGLEASAEMWTHMIYTPFSVPTWPNVLESVANRIVSGGGGENKVVGKGKGQGNKRNRGRKQPDKVYVKKEPAPVKEAVSFDAPAAIPAPAVAEKKPQGKPNKPKQIKKQQGRTDLIIEGVKYPGHKSFYDVIPGDKNRCGAYAAFRIIQTRYNCVPSALSLDDQYEFIKSAGNFCGIPVENDMLSAETIVGVLRSFNIGCTIFRPYNKDGNLRLTPVISCQFKSKIPTAAILHHSNHFDLITQFIYCDGSSDKTARFVPSVSGMTQPSVVSYKPSTSMESGRKIFHDVKPKCTTLCKNFLLAMSQIMPAEDIAHFMSFATNTKGEVVQVFNRCGLLPTDAPVPSVWLKMDETFDLSKTKAIVETLPQFIKDSYHDTHFKSLLDGVLPAHEADNVVITEEEHAAMDAFFGKSAPEQDNASAGETTPAQTNTTSVASEPEGPVEGPPSVSEDESGVAAVGPPLTDPIPDAPSLDSYVPPLIVENVSKFLNRATLQNEIALVHRFNLIGRTIDFHLTRMYSLDHLNDETLFASMCTCAEFFWNKVHRGLAMYKNAEWDTDRLRFGGVSISLSIQDMRALHTRVTADCSIKVPTRAIIVISEYPFLAIRGDEILGTTDVDTDFPASMWDRSFAQSYAQHFYLSKVVYLERPGLRRPPVEPRPPPPPPDTITDGTGSSAKEIINNGGVIYHYVDLKNEMPFYSAIAKLNGNKDRYSKVYSYYDKPALGPKLPMTDARVLAYKNDKLLAASQPSTTTLHYAEKGTCKIEKPDTKTKLKKAAKLGVLGAVMCITPLVVVAPVVVAAAAFTLIDGVTDQLAYERAYLRSVKRRRQVVHYDHAVIENLTDVVDFTGKSDALGTSIIASRVKVTCPHIGTSSNVAFGHEESNLLYGTQQFASAYYHSRRLVANPAITTFKEATAYTADGTIQSLP